MEGRNTLSNGGEDDSSDDGLWSEFENSATAVANLFRGANWRNLQSAAASTTQLYKNGLEAKKRSFEKGFQSGRQALAKEVFALCRPYCSKIEVEDVVKLLSRYAPPPANYHPPSHEHHQPRSPAQRQHRGAGSESSGGVNLFQQALCPVPSSPTSVQHRSPDLNLNQFLTTQVHRHGRKRTHAGNSPSMSGQHDGAEMLDSIFFPSYSNSKRSKYS